MRNVKRHFDGIMIQCSMSYATKQLKEQEIGSTLLVTALNGQELFVKDKNGVRVSTEEEWKNYWTK